MSDNFKMRKVKGLAEMLGVLKKFDDAFSPALSEIVPSLEGHAKKLARHAENYLLMDGEEICGWISFYDNDEEGGVGYLTHLAVDEKYRGRGLGGELLRFFERECTKRGMNVLKLEVQKGNIRARRLYKEMGFKVSEELQSSIYMERDLS